VVLGGVKSDIGAGWGLSGTWAVTMGDASAGWVLYGCWCGVEKWCWVWCLFWASLVPER
jgi:hypothetical protein